MAIPEENVLREKACAAKKGLGCGELAHFGFRCRFFLIVPCVSLAGDLEPLADALEDMADLGRAADRARDSLRYALDGGDGWRWHGFHGRACREGRRHGPPPPCFRKKHHKRKPPWRHRDD